MTVPSDVAPRLPANVPGARSWSFWGEEARRQQSAAGRTPRPRLLPGTRAADWRDEPESGQEHWRRLTDEADEFHVGVDLNHGDQLLVQIAGADGELLATAHARVVEELRQTTAHELIHAHFAPLLEIVREDLHNHLSAPAYHLLDAGFTRHLEFGVDAMTCALAPHLPLIEWPR